MMAHLKHAKHMLGITVWGFSIEKAEGMMDPVTCGRFRWSANEEKWCLGIGDHSACLRWYRGLND